jgi:hypothetical protein
MESERAEKRRKEESKKEREEERVVPYIISGPAIN